MERWSYTECMKGKGAASKWCDILFLCADYEESEEIAMRLKDTNLTAEELKDIVRKYMVETYERYDFIAERAEGMHLYDEEGNAYLDFYGGKQPRKPEPESGTGGEGPDGRYRAYV